MIKVLINVGASFEILDEDYKGYSNIFEDAANKGFLE
jgi:hypothetical protein